MDENIRSYLMERLIFEAKDPHEIYNEYYSDIPYDDFYKIIKADPRTKEKNDKLKKIGKYAKILLDLYREGNLKFEDLDKANHYLDIAYERNVPLPKEEINSISDIYEKIKGYIAQEEHDIETLLDMVDSDEYDLIKNTENWYVFKAETENAACKLGAGTEWCTAHGQYSVDKDKQDRENAFEEYSNNLIIFINKNDNSEKYQLYYEPYPDSAEDIENEFQFMDKEDSEVNPKEFLENNDEELYEVFIPNIDAIYNITQLDGIVDAHMLLVKVQWLAPQLLSEVNADNNPLLTTAYMGMVDDSAIDEIEKEYSNRIEDIAIGKGDEPHLIPDTIEFTFDFEDLESDPEFDDNVAEQLELHGDIKKLGSILQFWGIPQFLEDDPAFNEGIGDKVIETTLDRAGISDDNERAKIKKELKDQYGDIIKNRVENKIVDITRNFARDLIKRGKADAQFDFTNEGVVAEIHYHDFITYIENKNIKELTPGVIYEMYMSGERDIFPVVDSKKEFYELRDRYREWVVNRPGSKVDDPQLAGMRKLIEELVDKVEELKEKNFEEEVKKIKRLIEHD